MPKPQKNVFVISKDDFEASRQRHENELLKIELGAIE
jgi:hypothetical protein